MKHETFNMKLSELKSKIREIPDWPEKGVNFKDITPLLQDREAFVFAIEEMSEPFLKRRPDIIVGVDARGFILAAALAYKLRTGLAIVRKTGKLPFQTVKQSYKLEYGTATVEIHKDAIFQSQKVLIVDDVLATGGTLRATVDLVEKLKGDILGITLLIELSDLGGREKLKGYDIHSLITY